jgi:hypothetical protein
VVFNKEIAVIALSPECVVVYNEIVVIAISPECVVFNKEIVVIAPSSECVPLFLCKIPHFQKIEQ